MQNRAGHRKNSLECKRDVTDGIFALCKVASAEYLPARLVWDGKIQTGTLPFLSGQPCLVQVSVIADRASPPAKRVSRCHASRGRVPVL